MKTESLSYRYFGMGFLFARWGWVLFMGWWGVGSASASVEPRAAGCLIPGANQTVFMVQNRWSRTWSLPGGWMEPGESTAQGAVRETLEETGVQVEAHEVLHQFGIFVLHRCYPVGGTLLLKPFSTYSEVLQTDWVNPSRLEGRRLRFQSQKDKLVALSQADWTKAIPRETLREEPGGAWWNRLELPWIRRFQRSWPSDLSFIWKAFNFLGEETFVYLGLPLVWWTLSRLQALGFTFLLLFSTFINAVAKGVIGLPRPFQYDPSLLSSFAGTSHGFGLPSGHTQLTMVFWGAWVALIWPSRKGAWALALSAAVLTGLSRVYLGAHFFSDVAVGLSIGLLLVALYGVFRERWERFLSRPMVLLLFWGGVSVMGGFLWQGPDPTGVMAAGLGGSLGTFIYPPDSKRFGVIPSGVLAPQRLFGLWLVSILGLFAWLTLMEWFRPQDIHYTAYLRYRVLKYLGLGFWLTSGMAWAGTQLSRLWTTREQSP